MPDPFYHFGYETWPMHDGGFPQPIPNDIQVESADEKIARVTCRASFPTVIPHEKVYMERSAGIAHSWRFTVAIVAELEAGTVKTQLVCTAQHVKWFEEHGETGAGNVQTFVVNPQDLTATDSVSITSTSAHGIAHFDRVFFTCDLLATGTLFIQMIGIHQSLDQIDVPYQPKVTPPGGSEPPAGDAPSAGPQPPSGTTPSEGPQPSSKKKKKPTEKNKKPDPKPVAMKSTGKKRVEY